MIGWFGLAGELVPGAFVVWRHDYYYAFNLVHCKERGINRQNRFVRLTSLGQTIHEIEPSSSQGGHVKEKQRQLNSYNLNTSASNFTPALPIPRQRGTAVPWNGSAVYQRGVGTVPSSC